MNALVWSSGEVRPGEVVLGLVGRKAVMLNASPRASVLLG